MKNSYHWWGLGAIILIALFLRFYQLDSLPAILNRDEAALGYNALLLSQVGVDEWGRSWPLSLESFGDFKLPGYPLALVGLLKLFEPSDWLVRLPSALAGVALIALAALWTKTLSRSLWLGLVAATSLALTPVFFFYSRIAFEANLALSLLVASLLLLYIRPIKPIGRAGQDLLACLLWLLAALTYNTPLLLLPLIAPLIMVIRGVKNYRGWILPLFLLTIIGASLLNFQLSLTEQKSAITIFSDQEHLLKANERFSTFADQYGIGQLGSYSYYVTQIGQRVIASFSYQFLVGSGGSHPLHQLPGAAHLTISLFVLALAGIGKTIWQVGVFLKKRLSAGKLSLTSLEKIKIELVSLYLLVVSLAPAAVTVDAPHATRSLLFFMILVGFGVYALKDLNRYAVMTALAAHLIFFGSYQLQYWTDFPANQPTMLQTGLSEALEQVEALEPKEVAVVDSGGYLYILVAWYLKTPAKEFLGTTVRQQPDSIGFRYGERMGRYHFVGALEDRAESARVLLEWQNDRWQVLEL